MRTVIGVRFRTNPKVYYFDPKGEEYIGGKYVYKKTDS